MTDQPNLPDEPVAPPADSPVAVTEAPPAEQPSANGTGPQRPPSSAMILFDQVTKIYEPNIRGLDDVSLQIDKGESCSWSARPAPASPPSSSCC